MLDMKNLTKEEMRRYNLEKVDFDCDNEDEFFIMIANTSWWVVGIDEKKGIIYAENDGDGVFHNVSYADIEELELKGYAIIGVQGSYIKGLISTRDAENPIDDVKSFINDNQVYKLVQWEE